MTRKKKEPGEPGSSATPELLTAQDVLKNHAGPDNLGVYHSCYSTVYFNVRLPDRKLH